MILALFKEAGLPMPRLEYHFAKPKPWQRRKWAFDFAWPNYRVALEVEGGIWVQGRHVRGKGYENDCRKYSVAAIAGWAVIRATQRMLENGEAIEMVKQAVEIRHGQ